MDILSFINLIFLNAGSAVMFFSVFHLYIGNTLIGLFELWIVRKIFKIRLRWWLVILANYISMLFGFLFFASYFTEFVIGKSFFPGFDRPFTIFGFLFGMFFAFLASVIIEFPFFHFAFKENRNYIQTLKITIITNIYSYITMIAIYFLFIFFGNEILGLIF